LGRATPAETVDRAFQVLGLHWAGAGEEPVRRAGEELLRGQHDDGGWSQLPTLPSDAYATGQVLVALHEGAGLPVDHPAYQRGVEYLLRTQGADGTWFVQTRCFPVVEPVISGFPHGRAQFSSTAGTCWATMALTLAGARGERGVSTP
jgi:hypothetical protein